MTLRSRPASTTPQTAGAARVSAAWLIVLVVLFLVAIAFAFLTQSDMSSLQERLDTAIAEKAAAEAATETERDIRRALSVGVGFYPAEAADPNSNVEALTEGLDRLRSAFPDHLSETNATFESMIPGIISAYNSRGTELTALSSERDQAKANEDAARTAAATTTQEKDATIAGLRGDLSDEQQNASARQQDLEDRLGAAQEQTSERDSELRAERSSWNEERRALEQEIARLQVRISDLSAVTTFAREPYADKADAEVLTVSESLPYGWINVGANQRLTTGTRFRVESGTPGLRRFKAWAEVTEVDAGKAQVLFTDLVDRFDPVAPGDVVINPLFDPTGERNAVLAGRFSGTYTRDELKVLLERVGINVQPDLGLTPHFLIVGQELYYDEDGEPLEDPMQPEDLAVYKQAEEQQVEIIPLQDLQAFFRAGS